jgi:CBS domain containing-hemolysin-like protein
MREFIEARSLWLPGGIAMLGLMAASAFFSACETSLFYLSRDELRAMQRGRPRERRVAELLDNPEGLLTTILFWNLLVNLAFFAVSVVTARRLALHDQTAAAGVFSVMTVAGLIVFGEVLPKAGAVLLRRSVAVLVTRPLSAAVCVARPITPILKGTATAIRRAFWPRLRQEPYLDVGDLERAIETSHAGADLIRHEQRVLHNILDLSEITVEEVMRPRGSYTAWSPPVHLEDLRSGHQGDYLYLRDEGPDQISSAVELHSRSMLPQRNLEALAAPVIHVPWCATLADTLEQLRDSSSAVAVVVNEFGETIGVVNHEDIVDAVLSPEPSRARRILRREPILEVAPSRYHADGITSLRYLAQRLNVDFEPTIDGLTTVSGLLHDELERLPVVGDEIPWHGWRIQVIDADRRGRVRVALSPWPSNASERTRAAP